MKENFSQYRIGITGSPGTGKKTVGEALAKILDLELISINNFAIKNHFAIRKGSEFVVDLDKLEGKIKTDSRIVVGHLLPYIVPNRDLDFVAVLRCSPRELRRRYEFRRYSESKIIENIEAEIIGLVADKASQVYASEKLTEFDTTRTKPGTIARRIVNVLKGKLAPSFGSVDWLTAPNYSAFSEMLHGKCNRFNTPKRITRFANRKARKSRY